MSKLKLRTFDHNEVENPGFSESITSRCIRTKSKITSGLLFQSMDTTSVDCFRGTDICRKE